MGWQRLTARARHCICAVFSLWWWLGTGGEALVRQAGFILLEMPFMGQYNEHTPSFLEHIVCALLSQQHKQIPQGMPCSCQRA